MVMLINWLQADAGSHFSEAVRDMQQHAIQAMGREASGEMRVGYAYADAFRLWFESDSLASLADERGDPDAARRYAAARDGLAELSLHNKTRHNQQNNCKEIEIPKTSLGNV